jgi:hypothetical protein
MWVRGAAIRPVPRFAVVPRSTLDQIERELADDSPRAQGELDGAFARFESTQPHLADAISQVLSRPLHPTALALGYFLSISVWLAFERTFGEARLRQVSTDALDATDQAIALEEEIRSTHGAGPFDLNDVVAVEQPNVLNFVHEHVDAAFDPASARGGAAKETRAPADPHAKPTGKSHERPYEKPYESDVRAVVRATVLLTLCLSHAVLPLSDTPRGSAELMA